jgi:tRNA (guanine26-N2/guanine27-N2)-dimethyltransferase
MYQTINEGKAQVIVDLGKVSKKLEVFYNPVMRFNRDVSVLLLNSLGRKDLQIGLPLAASGVRGVRFLKEVKGIRKVYFNDISKEAVKLIKKNIKMNKVRKIKVSNKDANIFLLESKGFDYIDIDPFGSPVGFLDSAIRRLSREGLLAVTATDTGALAGSFPAAGLRKYWAKSVRNNTMHENGLRILIRRVQLVAASQDKALIPIYSYSKDHYYRVFFKCEKGKQKVDKILKEHGMFNNAGEMWLGQLWDKKLAAAIAKESDDKFLKIISGEGKIGVVGFHNIPRICKEYKLEVRKQDKIISRIKKKGYKVAVTHFADSSLRSDISENELIKLL